MPQSLSLVDPLAARDLTTFLQRAARLDGGAVRLIAGGGVLAAYVAARYPRGILDVSPTVLGMRAYEVSPRDAFDAVVSLRAVLDRLARVTDASADAPVPAILLPAEETGVAWAGVAPPRGGWAPAGELGVAEFEASVTDAAAAARALGFLADDPVRVFDAGRWTRFTTHRGHVLVHRR